MFVLVAFNAATLPFLHREPVTEVKFNQLLAFRRNYGSGGDAALVSFDLKADFRPSWNWNTKQVFAYVYFEYTTKKNVVNQVVVWDRIIKNVEDANIDEQAIRAEYLLADQGYHLKNADVKLHVGWDITPITGFLHGGRSTGAHVTLPDEYLPQ